MKGQGKRQGTRRLLANILYSPIAGIMFVSCVGHLCVVCDWIVNSLPCTLNFPLKRIPVLYEVEFSDVYESA